VFLAIAAAVAALSGGQAGLPLKPCTLPGHVHARCGTLAVPEDRRTRGGAKIRLFVGVLGLGAASAQRAGLLAGGRAGRRCGERRCVVRIDCARRREPKARHRARRSARSRQIGAAHLSDAAGRSRRGRRPRICRELFAHRWPRSTALHNRRRDGRSRCGPAGARLPADRPLRRLLRSDRGADLHRPPWITRRGGGSRRGDAARRPDLGAPVFRDPARVRPARRALRAQGGLSRRVSGSRRRPAPSLRATARGADRRPRRRLERAVPGRRCAGHRQGLLRVPAFASRLPLVLHLAAAGDYSELVAAWSSLRPAGIQSHGS
jgi:hypothetical protein